ncbi:MAG TPA: DegV family protein [Candidatus Baltobacteraceae bacterium]|nr:DegV family protein [Candidatus Baltobacteraceae bacterium]
MPIAVLTDSTSDIEPARARELGITVVPLFVIFGEKSYRDYVDLSRREFYEKLATEPVLPITSQPTSQMFEDAFRPHVEAGDDIVCIVISSKLSGTINAARSAAQQFPGAKIHIVDSLSVAGGLGMQALHACALAKAGASVQTVLDAIDHEKRTQHLYACIPDLSHVVRTGRIGKAKAVIGTLMKIVPVISLRDGEVVAEAQVRTLGRAQQTMIDLSLRHITDASRARFLVMHTNAPDLARDILERLRAQLGDAEPEMLDVLEAGPVIATHGGPGAVGIFSAQD